MSTLQEKAVLLADKLIHRAEDWKYGDGPDMADEKQVWADLIMGLVKEGYIKGSNTATDIYKSNPKNTNRQ